MENRSGSGESEYKAQGSAEGGSGGGEGYLRGREIKGCSASALLPTTGWPALGLFDDLSLSASRGSLTFRTNLDDPPSE